MYLRNKEYELTDYEEVAVEKRNQELVVKMKKNNSVLVYLS